MNRLGRSQAMAIMALALAGSLGGATDAEPLREPRDPLPPWPEPKPREMPEADRKRLAKAQAKRDKKAAKLRERGHL